MFDISNDLSIAKEMVIRAMERDGIDVTNIDTINLTKGAEYLLTRQEFPEMKEKPLKELE